MKKPPPSLLFVVLQLVVLFFVSGETRGQGDVVLSSGRVPDLNGFTSEGKPVNLKEYAKGHYTVIAAGCLTCPEFRRGYAEVEAALADYSPLGVQFLYVYKSLRHPELEGMVEPQNLQERLLHVARAKETLGTKAPWFADSMDDSIRDALGAGANSIYLISPTGEVLLGLSRLNGEALRKALETHVGPVENPTTVSDLDLPRVGRPEQMTNIDSDVRVERPEGMVIISSTPTASEETYYVKLRVEAEPALLETGKGRLFLGFYPDPILGAHWNNLTKPMKYSLTLPTGVTATPQEASAVRGEGDYDSEPRQFWVEIDSAKPSDKFKLAFHYYGCTEEVCLALTHGYDIELVAADDGSRTYGFNRGQKGGKGKGGKGGKGKGMGKGNR
ncbi:MAG: hypothetical protein P1U68_03170 [Verrucomicrobiales bacterium]|nr:hypothetical protein [Verrucomicrobiales bacterium]